MQEIAGARPPPRPGWSAGTWHVSCSKSAIAMAPERGLLVNDGTLAAHARPPRWLVAPGVELSVVIPVHDEADCVAPLLREIRAVLDGQVEYEIVVVDDASTDATLDRLRSAMDDDRRLVVV